LIRDISSLHFK